MAVIFQKIDDILKHYKVKSYKALASGDIAIRKDGNWLYFTWKTNRGYVITGSSSKLMR